MIHFNAHFDGKNLCPDEPVSLPKGVTLRVTVTEVRSGKEDGDSERDQPRGPSPAELLAQIESEAGLIDGPEDWSTEHD